MKQYFKFKKGVVPILVILIVLLASTAIVFYVIRNQKKIKALSPNPAGNIHATPTSAANTGSITFTATEVAGANGAQIDNVRYYLLNPTLASSNNWGNPDWCSVGATCTQSTDGLVTYDISQSSNPGDNYAITWNSSTHSSGSTPYSRALTATNIPPGTYTVGLRVEDVNHNVNGGASSMQITITDGTLPSPSPLPSPKTYQYLIRVANTDENVRTIEDNPSRITNSPSQNYTFTLGANPDSRGYTAFVCSPDCSIVSRGLDPGLARYAVQFTPNLVGGKLVLKSQGPVNLNVDQDGDRFTYGMELYHGTDPNDNCSDNTNVFAWPADFNNDKKITAVDIFTVVQKVGATGGIWARYDLKPDSKIDSADVAVVQSLYGKTCQ